jgi:protein O-GlcNAc transferase
VWAGILRAAPSARLLIVARGAQNKAFQNQIVSNFVARGVRADRVLIQPTLPLKGFLALFDQLDATLDPFPYGGGTTTFHSLWMGAPVVTLAGTTAFSRNSIGPLTEVGLANLIATTPEQYIEVAARLASDLAWIADARASLRARMKASLLVDQRAFASYMEYAYRAMWRNYCSGGTTEVRVMASRHGVL